MFFIPFSQPTGRECKIPSSSCIFLGVGFPADGSERSHGSRTVAKDQEQLESLTDEDEIEDDDEIEVDEEDIVLDDDLEVDDALDADLDDEIAVLDEDDDEADKGESDDDDDDDEDTEASLDEILAERAKAELVVVDDDDDDDLLELVSEDTKGVTPLRAKITPVKDKQEFVCARCHLVKNRAQMADPKRGLCRDCV
ncbi:MAG: DUF4193 family protein [Actinobacteria bacterium]|nr:DUF4193 family protein [Actinomycetota bacterium]